MGNYVTESVINGLVDVLWDTDGTGQVLLTVQNLKPIFKACEKYISDMYKSKDTLVSLFDTGADVKLDANWPAKEVTLP